MSEQPEHEEARRLSNAEWAVQRIAELERLLSKAEQERDEAGMTIRDLQASEKREYDRAEEAEAERDSWIDAYKGTAKDLEAAERELERLRGGLRIGLEAAEAELGRAEEHHRWHHDREGREVEPDEERLRVLLLIAEALDDPAALSADTQREDG